MKKLKFKFLTLILSLFVFTTYAGGDDTEREFNESWPASSVETLQIINKFGEVKINNDGGSEITIDVLVTVETFSSSKAEKVLDQIEVVFSKSGSKIKAETNIENNFKHRQKFSIDYTVNIPSDKNLIIENKFGDVIINKLKAKGNINIGYGNLSAVTLHGKSMGDINIELSYGKANVESISDAEIEMKYSKFFIGDINTLDLDSKYSVVSIDEINSFKAESKYDTYNFDKVGSFNAELKYTNVKIEELAKSLKIGTGYGGITVDEIADDFEFIEISNSYGKINLGLSENAAYNVKASCDYCGISYNESNFSGNRESRDHSKKIDGKIGDGNSNSWVNITSRYGSIDLRD